MDGSFSDIYIIEGLFFVQSEVVLSISNMLYILIQIRHKESVSDSY